MKEAISVVALATVLTAGSAFATGYRIPEQSALSQFLVALDSFCSKFLFKSAL